MRADPVLVRSTPRPPSGSELAAALRDRIPAGPEPAMVVDGRAAAARDGSTSTYRLLAALGLPRAAPVGAWTCDPGAAWDALDVLLDTLPVDGRLLLVAVGGRAPYTWAGAIVARTGPHLPYPPMPSDRTLGNGFLALILGAVSPGQNPDTED